MGSLPPENLEDIFLFLRHDEWKKLWMLSRTLFDIISRCVGAAAKAEELRALLAEQARLNIIRAQEDHRANADFIAAIDAQFAALHQQIAHLNNEIARHDLEIRRLTNQPRYACAIM